VTVEYSSATDAELKAAGTNYPDWVHQFTTLPSSGYRTSDVLSQIHDLALQIISDAGATNPYDEATAIQNYLRDPQNYTYTLTCGTGANVTSAQIVVPVSLPTVTMATPSVPSLRIGQTIYLDWNTNAATPCTATGGGPGDGWAGSPPHYFVTETVPGTYTFGITCGQGHYAVSAQTQVTFTNDPPTVSLTLTPNQGTVANSMNTGYTLITVNWVANVFPCIVSVSGPDPSADLPTYPYFNGPSGSPQDTRAVTGQYVYTVTCGSGVWPSSFFVMIWRSASGLLPAARMRPA